MRVLLVGNYEPDHQESMQRYASWLEKILKARGHQVALIKPCPFFSNLSSHPGLSKYLGYLDKFLIFPWHLRRLAKTFDLVHVLDHSNSMYLRVVRGKPNLITCHDLLAIRAAQGEFSESPTGWSGKLLQRWILSGLRRARHVLCVSTKTANDLKALTGETGAHDRIVYNSINWNYQPGAPFPSGFASKLGLRAGQRYLLHVGSTSWYKNRPGVVRIFAQLATMEEFSTTVLVMVGKAWGAALRILIREEQLSNRIVEAGSVSNEELQALYGNALALLFPSLEEGFGWPILEAQACGCPVVTTGRPPMSEVAGDAAILIDPENIPAAAALIASGLQRREQLRADGFRNLARFDQEVIADQYCSFYKAVLEDGYATER